MQQLQLHMDPCLHVDATCEPPLVATRLQRLLSSRVFHVQDAAFEGMEHLITDPPPLTAATALAFTSALPLLEFE